MKIRGLKFKIDENLPAEFAAILGDAGFEAATVAEETLTGATDTLLLERCRAERRVLVTLDLDFANAQAHPPGTHSGVLVFRSKAQDKLTLISLLKRTVPVLKGRSPEGQLWIVQATAFAFESRARYISCPYADANAAPNPWFESASKPAELRNLAELCNVQSNDKAEGRM